MKPQQLAFDADDNLDTIVAVWVKPLEETIAEINSVTSADVLRVAEKMLAPQNLRMAVIAPDPAPIADNFKKLTNKEAK